MGALKQKMKGSRPKLAVAFLVGVLAVGFLTVAHAQAPQKRENSWSKVCKSPAGPNKGCAAVYRIVDKRGRRIVSFLAARLKASAYLEIESPLGIFIPFGVRVRVDKKKPNQTNLIDCSKRGCRSFIPLSSTLLAHLKTGRKLQVIFRDSKTQKVLIVTGSLKGFSRAF